MKTGRAVVGYFDASVREELKRKGEGSLKGLINDALDDTSSACVLAGSARFERPWICYEMLKSIVCGNKIIAAHVKDIKGKGQRERGLGENPLTYAGVTYSDNGGKGTLWGKAGAQ